MTFGLAFVNETVFLFDPGADVARRTRQCRADKNFQCLFLRGAQKACASAHVEAGQTFNPALLEQLAPVADRVVVKKQRSGHSLAAPPVIEQHNRVGPPRHTRGRRPVARQPDQSCPILFAKEAASKSFANPNPLSHKTQGNSPEFSISRGIQSLFLALRMNMHPALHLARAAGNGGEEGEAAVQGEAGASA